MGGFVTCKLKTTKFKGRANGNKFPLGQLTPFQMRSSRTPICRYGTRAHPLGLNLMSIHSLGHQSSGLCFAISLLGKPKTHEWKKNGEDPLPTWGRRNHSFFKSPKKKPSPNLRENIPKSTILLLQKIVLADRSARLESPINSGICRLYCFTKLFGETPTAPFIAFLILLLQGFAYWKKGRSASLRRIAKHAWRCSDFSFFVLFSPFKTQITHAKINCVPKDSSCDTPLPKILMLVILATCASSSSTKNQESDKTLTLKKRNKMHVFTHRLAFIFQLIFGSAHFKIKNVFLRLVMGMSAK
ncbi:hypothetical protein H5410_000847, partial [Solanum commersonii]